MTVRAARVLRDDGGMALVLVLMASSFLLVLGSSLVLETVTETMISSNYRDGIETFYAAEAGAGAAMARLVAAESWMPQSGFVSGRLEDLLGIAPSGPPIFVTASLIDAGVPDRIVVVSRADGPGQTRRIVKVTVARPADVNDRLSLRIVAWEEIR